MGSPAGLLGLGREQALGQYKSAASATRGPWNCHFPSTHSGLMLAVLDFSHMVTSALSINSMFLRGAWRDVTACFSVKLPGPPTQWIQIHFPDTLET